MAGNLLEIEKNEVHVWRLCFFELLATKILFYHECLELRWMRLSQESTFGKRGAVFVHARSTQDERKDEVENEVMSTNTRVSLW